MNRTNSTENLLPAGAPQSTDWWVEANGSEKEQSDSAGGLPVVDEDRPVHQFRNCGLETWNQGRAAWRSYDDDGK